MKRCYYISNSYDGAYFVLTDNIEEYFQRISAYLLNLENSKKCNHYSFGSVEMSEKEYLEKRTGASFLERSKIAEKEKEIQAKSHEIIAESGTEVYDDEDDFDPPPAPPTPKKGERPHLRLV